MGDGTFIVDDDAEKMQKVCSFLEAASGKVMLETVMKACAVVSYLSS